MNEAKESEMRKLFSERLNALIEKKGIQQNNLADIIGVSESTVGKWLLQKAMPRMGAIQRLADYFSVPKSYFLEKNYKTFEPLPIPHMVKIPILGTVVAGEPLMSEENILGYEEIPEKLARIGDMYGLYVHGDSMTPTMQDGDIIIVHHQTYANTGDIAIVLVNGDEATVKEVKYSADGITLIGHNATVFPPRFYTAREVQYKPVAICGVVYSVHRNLKQF